MNFAWSKTPLKLVLILILAAAINGSIILGLHAAVSYRMEMPVEEATLAQLDETWIDCEILDRREISGTGFSILLVRKNDGTIHLITLQKHYLLDRCRIIKKACQSVPQTGEIINLKTGITQIQVSVQQNNQTGKLYLKPEGTGVGYSPKQQFRNQMILGITGLCILELAIWCLVFRKEEIA